MGSGSWRTSDFTTYSCSVGRSVSSSGRVTTCYATAREAYKANRLADSMDPCVEKNRIRECRDCEDHPETVPIILALDVTGSMGEAAIEVSRKLNDIVKGVTDRIKDAEFMIMGIGDIDYDSAPVQYSQFESDVRIAQCLDQIYFEMGGGGNDSESYTAAWYVGLHRTDCDCWKRGRKGLILTMGDEFLNARLRHDRLAAALGEHPQGDVGTKDLFREVSEKFDIAHVVVNHAIGRERYFASCARSFADVIGPDNVRITTPEEIASVIVQFIVNKCGCPPASASAAPSLKVSESGDGTMGVITWAP